MRRFAFLNPCPLICNGFPNKGGVARGGTCLERLIAASQCGWKMSYFHCSFLSYWFFHKSIHWRIKGGAQGTAPWVQFLWFYAVFEKIWPNHRLVPQPWGLAPPLKIREILNPPLLSDGTGLNDQIPRNRVLCNIFFSILAFRRAHRFLWS